MNVNIYNSNAVWNFRFRNNFFISHQRLIKIKKLDYNNSSNHTFRLTFLYLKFVKKNTLGWVWIHKQFFVHFADMKIKNKRPVKQSTHCSIMRFSAPTWLGFIVRIELGRCLVSQIGHSANAMCIRFKLELPENIYSKYSFTAVPSVDSCMTAVPCFLIFVCYVFWRLIFLEPL